MGNLIIFKLSKISGKSLQLYAVSDSNSKLRKRRSLSKLLEGYKVKTDLEFWDESKERFKTHIHKNIPIPTAEEDNRHIEALLNELEAVAKKTSCSYDQVFDLYLDTQTHKKEKVPSVLEYTIHFTELWKQNKVNKNYTHETNNYRIYEKLYHKLQGLTSRQKQPWAEGMKRFADQPIDKVTDEDYNEFIKFLHDNKITIKDTYIAYKATIYHYQHTVRNNPSYTLKLNSESKEITQKAKQKKTPTETFSRKQLQQLLECDTDKITMPNNVSNELKRLYKDCALLMYYLYTRPCDVVSMRIEDLIIDPENNEYYWRYAASKLLNTTGEVIDTPIKDEALDIILKYKGDRTSGLLLPLPSNKLKEAGIRTWKRRWNKECCMIGRFLKAVSAHYKWNFRYEPTMYTLRRSVITHAIDKNISLEAIASIGHTSSREILRTYADRNQLARSINRNLL